MRHLTRIFTALVLAVAVCYATGCSMRPSTSGVMVGLSNLEKAEQQVQFNPAGPLPGASQEEIVRGFIAATSSANGDYEIAREYLTPQYQNKWQANGVTIDEGPRPFHAVDENVAVIKTNAVAVVQQSGELRPQPLNSQNIELRYEFERYDNEWRISSAPTNALLDQSTFTAVWTPYRLTFLDAADKPIQDTRWILNDSRAVTRAIDLLLQGPGATLRNGAKSVFGTQMRLAEPVQVKNGVAQINIKSGLVGATQNGLETAAMQISRTLSEFSHINRFVVAEKGNTLIRSKISRESTRQPSNTSYILTANNLLAIDSDKADPEINALYENVQKLSPDAVTLLPSNLETGNSTVKQAAVLRGGVVFLVSAADSKLLNSYQNNLLPTGDKWGYIWTLTSGGLKELTAHGGDGSEASFELPEVLKTSRIQAFRASPDGTQLAFLTQDNAGGSNIYLAAITRTPEGAPMALADEAFITLVAAGSAIDFDWFSNGKLVVMTQAGESGRITSGGAGYLPAALGQVQGAKSLAAAGSSAAANVLTSDGRVFGPRGTVQWSELANDVLVLIKSR